MNDPSPRSVSVAPPAPEPRTLTEGLARLLERPGPVLAAHLRDRGVGGEALMWFALALGGAAAFVLFAGHPGLGGLVGLLALASGEIALVPERASATLAPARVRAWSALLELALVASLVGGMVGREPPIALALGFLVLVLVAWLPRFEGLSPLAARTTLWPRGARLALLLLGALLGREVPALAFVAVAGLLEAWARMERLDEAIGFARREAHPVTARVLEPDGSVKPAVRWASFAVALLLLVVLPASAGWRF